MKEFGSILNYLKTFKAEHKNHPRTHSPQQNKKAVLTAAAYFKVSSPVRLQGQVNTTTEFFIFELVLPKLIILIFWTKFVQKGCFWSKSGKMNSAIKFCIFGSLRFLNQGSKEVPYYIFFECHKQTDREIQPISNRKVKRIYCVTRIRISNSNSIPLQHYKKMQFLFINAHLTC